MGAKHEGKRELLADFRTLLWRESMKFQEF